jgi:hypothetical protein
VAVASVFRGADAVINPTMPLLEAGEYWLKQIARPDSGLSARTIADYSWTWQKYVDSTKSSVRGLTLQQANDPQRLRGFLQRVAEAHGSASAKKAKSVLHGVIGYAVDNGVLPSDATRQVRTVTSTAAKSKERDHTRAMTRSERDHVIEATRLAAGEPRVESPHPAQAPCDGRSHCLPGRHGSPDRRSAARSVAGHQP